ncbi:ribosome maturation factor RimM [Prevotella sp. CAG:1185]|uniref:ribosome maturation factor RimM n=1 Tax=uncultured Prevotella sp. TaxID=159272 RepID=UPI000338BE12|nr:ribosome maturation factor RimM [uncultured Prevotella sp.]CCY80749.1 ribosome maturation factor RimM [Prevotella sp. CAG:1185]
MIRQEEVFKIGKIGKPHGVKGEVSLMFEDDVFDRVDADYLVLLIDGILVPFFFEEYRFKSDETALVKFCDIDTKEQAQELTGCDVYFSRKLSEDGREDMSLNEAENFKLLDANNDNSLIGTVKSVDYSTVNTLFNVETPDGKEIMIPASEDFIVDIDTEKHFIVVDLPEGLLDLD